MRRIAVFAFAALALASCGKSDEKTVVVNDKGDKVTVSGNGQQFSVKSDDGKTTVNVNTSGVTSDLHLPAYVSVFPGAKVVSSANGMGTNGNGGMVLIETNAAPADVVAFYKKQGAAAGLTEKMSMTQQSATVLAYGTDDGKRSLEVTVNPGDNGAGSRAQVIWSGG